MTESGSRKSDGTQMTDAEYEELKARTVAAAERGARGELTKAERVQTRDDIGLVLAEANRRIAAVTKLGRCDWGRDA